MNWVFGASTKTFIDLSALDGECGQHPAACLYFLRTSFLVPKLSWVGVGAKINYTDFFSIPVKSETEPMTTWLQGRKQVTALPRFPQVYVCLHSAVDTLPLNCSSGSAVGSLLSSSWDHDHISHTKYRWYSKYWNNHSMHFLKSIHFNTETQQVIPLSLFCSKGVSLQDGSVHFHWREWIQMTRNQMNLCGLTWNRM